MPGYAGAGQAALLRNNQQVFLFQRERVGNGEASIAVQLERINRSHYPWGVSFQVYFSDVNGVPADPGAFEVDIQSSDADVGIQYCTINSWVNDTSLNPFFVGQIQLPSFYAKYVRASVLSLTNAVYVSVLATH